MRNQGYSKTYFWECAFGEDDQQAGLEQEPVNNVENGE
jgi:hypothetical protein